MQKMLQIKAKLCKMSQNLNQLNLQNYAGRIKPQDQITVFWKTKRFEQREERTDIKFLLTPNQGNPRL